MKNLYKVARGHTKRFPNGNDPYKITVRILEECGEVASEVNHFENSGLKVKKYGVVTKQKLADEVKQALCCLIQLVQYYGIEEELELSIQSSIDRIDSEQECN